MLCAWALTAVPAARAVEFNHDPAQAHAIGLAKTGFCIAVDHGIAGEAAMLGNCTPSVDQVFYFDADEHNTRIRTANNLCLDRADPASVRGDVCSAASTQVWDIVDQGITTDHTLEHSLANRAGTAYSTLHIVASEYYSHSLWNVRDVTAPPRNVLRQAASGLCALTLPYPGTGWIDDCAFIAQRQGYYAVPLGNARYQLLVPTGGCLGVFGRSTAQGGSVTYVVCKRGDSAQEWQATSSGTAGLIFLRNRNSGRCLDTEWGRTAQFTSLTQGTCTQSGTQTWSAISATG